MRPTTPCIIALSLAAACATGSRVPAPGTTAGISVASTSPSSLRTFVDSMIDVPEFRSAHWGILIVDPGRGETLYSRNADKLFMPASNMKLVTGSTSLVNLGPDYRWSTTLFARGPIRDGVLAGDLVVRGNGDPSISNSMQKGDALAPLRALADSLRAHGVTRIRGTVAAAPSPFTDDQIGYGWSYDDLDYGYGAGVDALYLNEGFTEIVVHGGVREGDPVRATTRPVAAYPALIVRARTSAPLRADATPAERSASRKIAVAQDSSHTGVAVTGTIAAGDSVVEELSYRHLTDAYLAAMREALASRGIAVEGGATDTTARLDSIATLRSPTLREVLPFFEKPSQNQIGELLLKTMGIEKAGAGRADSAARFVERQLSSWGIPADAFKIRDGSGLSRHSFLSPRAIVTVLDVMRRHPEFRTFYEALPIAGIDGTIRNRMKGTPAQGNLHAKTGTLDRARSLSGYITAADGRMLLFSALCNNYSVPTSRVDQVTDALSVRLATMRLAP